MTDEIGRSGAEAPTGYSAEPEPSCTVSAVPVSIPNALAQIDCLVTTLERIAAHKELAPAKGRPPRILFESAVGCAELELYAWRTDYPDTARALEAYRDYWDEGGAWEQDLAASAIEARRAETSDSVEDEGAVPQGDAKPTAPNPIIQRGQGT